MRNNAPTILIVEDDERIRNPVSYTHLDVYKRQVLSFTLERGEVSINYVEYSILEGDVGYLSIYQFTGDDVEGVKEAISAFQQAGVSALVVDVRSNPGGLLTDVVDICDMLLPEGLIVYTEDRSGAREEYYADGEYWNVPMAAVSYTHLDVYKRQRFLCL